MEKYGDIIAVVIGLAVVLLLSYLGKRAQLFSAFMLRVVLCCVVIYFMNMGLNEQGIQAQVGYNAVTILTSGVLGFPGLLLLYGIKSYSLL